MTSEHLLEELEAVISGTVPLRQLSRPCGKSETRE